MPGNQLVTCRGCLLVGEEKDMQLLKGTIRGLFVKCNSIEVMVDS